MEEHTAGLIIVGDEILRGQIADANTSYLGKKLSAVGIRLRRVVIVPDVIDDIAEEVRLASVRYSVVFTGGGVGPTHDDVTYAAVAKGLNLKLEENKDLLAIYATLFPGQVEAKRLANAPSPCDVIYKPRQDSTKAAVKTYPFIKAANVYVLPGSPHYFSADVDVIIPLLQRGSTLHTDFVDVNLKELMFVDILDDLVNKWLGQVAVGSYPQPGRIPLTRITLEGSQSAVETAKLDLQTALTARLLNSSHQFALEDAESVVASSENQPHIKSALDVLRLCYAKHADGMFLNFNGGKDCTAVLHLMATVAKIMDAALPVCLYVSHDPFPEVEDFVKHAEGYYGLEIIWKTGTIRSALESLLKEQRNLNTGIMGMRRGDPGSDKLETFMPTDNGWPAMMRVNPILDWTYSQVWEFLLEHNVSYCSLYDQGYTSLGSKATTKPNPLLKNPDNPERYFPAYTLKDGVVERQGRG